MKAILMIGHGSRDPRGNEEAFQVARMLEDIARLPVSVGFIEHAHPPIPEAIETLYKKGFREIIVAPCILAAAAHVKKDIPRLAQHPGLSISIAPHIGNHPLLIEMLRERIGPGTLVVVSRGSSDPAAVSEVHAIAGEVDKDATVAFMGVSNPTLSEAIAGLTGPVLVLPFFLFSGILLTRMKEIIAPFSNVTLAANIGPDPRLAQILYDRIHGASKI